MPVTKEFKTIAEQIAILDSRHLKFKDKKKAAVQYWRIMNMPKTVGNRANILSIRKWLILLQN